MGLLHYLWSKIAASNATADAQVNWAEGMAPSAVNDSARAMMASLAGYRDDISGGLITGGTGAAYTLTTNQVFDSLAHMHLAMIAFIPHTTNTGACTLNVDGLGAKAIWGSLAVDLPAGTLIAGTPYVVTYRNDTGPASFVLQGFFGDPYNIPLAGGIDYWGATVPNAAFAFPIGQAISRTTYANLFAIIGTTYGAGDGSTTFNLPDKTGRVSAMKEASATRLTFTNSGVDGATLGSAGGAQTNTLTLAKLPTGITVTGTVTVSNNGTNDIPRINNGSSSLADVQTAVGTPNSRVFPGSVAAGAALTSSGSNTLTSNNTSGEAHANVQPTIICNYIIRVI